MKIKTRFAPSPTGHLHIGSIRTALYSWLFARNTGGKFILRIEDTDQARSSKKDINAIIKIMHWLNLDWDEGPYFQTNRLKIYHSYIKEMLIQGNAYKCYCSKRRLNLLRQMQIVNGKKPSYDGYCRRHHDRYHDTNTPYVVRFCNPNEGSVIFDDQILGKIEFNNKELDDFIILRTDGLPTYNFCVVIDDLDMQITHVIRGADHINNTPRQINIFKALNAPIPKYAHVSMIMDQDGKKLSKRNGAIGIMEYRDHGFLPEALLNYIVRLGWSHGNQEIFSIDEMKKLFSIHSINKSSSIINHKKLLWINHHFIKTLPIEEIINHLMLQLKKHNFNINDGPELTHVVNLLKKRCNTLKEIAENCRYFYHEFSTFDKYAAQTYLTPIAIQPLQILHTKLAALSTWSIETVQEVIRQTADILNLNIKNVSMPLRVAVTGYDRSPPIHIIVHVIGQVRSLSRINKALIFITTQLKQNNNKGL